MEATDRLSLPMLVPGQAQKEVFHNEALQILDAVVAAAVEETAQNDPPAQPAQGACYLVGPTPTGEWAQFAHHLASYSLAGWRFVAPTPGLVVFVKTTETFATFASSGWGVGTVAGSRLMIDGRQVVGPQAAAISNPAGGTTVDAEARATLEQLLEMLRSHGLIAA